MNQTKLIRSDKKFADICNECGGQTSTTKKLGEFPNNEIIKKLVKADVEEVKSFLNWFVGKNKKGTLLDVTLLLIVPLFLMISFGALALIWSNVSSGFASASESITVEGFNESAQNIIETPGNNFHNYADWFIGFLVFGIWIIILISSFLLGNHPAFFIFYFLLSFANIIIALILKSVYKGIIDGFTNFSSGFPVTSWIINNYLIVSLVFIFSIGVVLFLKPR